MFKSWCNAMTIRTYRGELYVDTWIRVQDRAPYRLRRRCPIQTRREAEAFEREIVGRAYGTRETTKTARTFEDFVRHEFKAYSKAHNSVAEVDRKRKCLKMHLLPAFGHLPLDAIGAREIDAYTAEKLSTSRPPSREGEPLRPPLSAKTVVNHLSVLRKALVLAHRYGELAAVPIVDWPKVPPQDFDFLSFDEAERLVAGADTGQWRTMMLVAMRTGLRCGELRALQWQDVDLVTGMLRVRRNATIGGKLKTPKSNRFREVPLSADALAALKSHRHLRGAFVFAHETGRMLREPECKHPCRRAAKRAGLRVVYWHVLRHTFASHLAMRGAPAKTIQELMGHASLAQTQRYMHLSPNVPRDAVRLLDLPVPKVKEETG